VDDISFDVVNMVFKFDIVVFADTIGQYGVQIKNYSVDWNVQST